MACYRDCVAVMRERLGETAVVMPPEPRTVARILGRRMLEVEERLGGIDRLAVLLEPFRRLRYADFIKRPAVVGYPVRSDERIALDLLDRKSVV